MSGAWSAQYAMLYWTSVCGDCVALDVAMSIVVFEFLRCTAAHCGPLKAVAGRLYSMVFGSPVLPPESRGAHLARRCLCGVRKLRCLPTPFARWLSSCCCSHGLFWGMKCLFLFGHDKFGRRLQRVVSSCCTQCCVGLVAGRRMWYIAWFRIRPVESSGVRGRVLVLLRIRRQRRQQQQLWLGRCLVGMALNGSPCVCRAWSAA